MIECRNLIFKYTAGENEEEKIAINDVSLQIKEGEFIAILGHNGSGKSTMATHMNALLIPTEGKMLVNKMDTSDMNNLWNIRETAGMVFQNPNPFPMSIFENVAYGLRCQGIRNKKILHDTVVDSLKKAALYEEVKDRLKDSALSLSGGQQQRLCIARAIAMHPDVILMDEPTSALDPIATLKIEELIDSLKDEFTIIIVTHNMQQAARISDYTAFFMLGEIVEYSLTEDLFKNPQQKKTEDYITGRFG